MKSNFCRGGVQKIHLSHFFCQAFKMESENRGIQILMNMSKLTYLYLKELVWGMEDEETKYQQKFRDAYRWKEMEIIQLGKGATASAPRPLIVVCRQGQSTTKWGWYQVNAQHPCAESLLKKITKKDKYLVKYINTFWNMIGQWSVVKVKIYQ